MTPVVADGRSASSSSRASARSCAEPIRTAADVERLRVPDPEEAVGPVLEAIGIVRRELAPEQAVVGFCGGPFTVAGYLVEGRPSRDFAATKTLMYREPAVWHALLEKLADTFAGVRRRRRRAPARTSSSSSTRGSARSRRPTTRSSSRRGRRASSRRSRAGVPTIHFGTGTATLLPAMAARRRRRDRPRLADPARRGLGARRRRTAACRGTSTRRCCSARGSASSRRRGTSSRAPAAAPGHIFNLGHGVLPATDPDVLGRAARARPRRDRASARGRCGRPAREKSRFRHTRVTKDTLRGGYPRVCSPRVGGG